jgi:hypothetical protein
MISKSRLSKFLKTTGAETVAAAMGSMDRQTEVKLTTVYGVKGKEQYGHRHIRVSQLLPPSDDLLAELQQAKEVRVSVGKITGGIKVKGSILEKTVADKVKVLMED